MKIEIKKLKLSDIYVNPDNPRTISAKAMQFLIKSIHDFPEMMHLREIIIDETGTVLGGNMRFAALKEIGTNEVIVKEIHGLTDSQKREFIIKDNGEWGRWNFDELANNWNDLPLIDWGIRGLPLGEDDPHAEWEGMPEFNDDGEAVKSITICFKEESEIKKFSELIHQEIGEKTKYIWFPERQRKLRKDTEIVSES